MDKYVPCLCYLCNGKLVSRYIRQKHAKVCGSANKQEPNDGCRLQRVLMSHEQVEDEYDHERDGNEQNDIVSDDIQLSNEQEVCNSIRRL